MADLMQVSGLWKNTSANGDTYLSGKLGPNVRILVFKNKYKTQENHPDYQVYFAPVERRENEGGNQGDEFIGDDFEGGDPAFQEGQSAHSQREAAPAPARQYATPQDALIDAPPARPTHYDQQRTGSPSPTGGRRPAPAASRPPTGPARRPAPPAQDYDDMGDLADPFAE